MIKQPRLALALSPFSVMRMEQRRATAVARQLPDLAPPDPRPRRQVVVARWQLADDGRLVAHWLPTPPEMA